MNRSTVLVLSLLMWMVTAPGWAQDALGEALKRAGIDGAGISSADLARTITSYAREQSGRRCALAFYFADELDRGALPAGFRLIVADGSAVRTAEIRAPGVEDQGMGALTRIHFTPNYVVIGGHWTPSAAPSIAVRWSDLKPAGVLQGWVLHALRGDRVVYHANLVHFAPTHPARVRLRDLATGADREVYPLKPTSPLWRKRVAHVAKLYREWGARLGNHHADPEQFDLAVRDSRYNPDTDTLVLLLDFSGPERNGLEYKDSLTEVVVIYRGISGKTVAEEAPLAEMVARHGASSFDDLVRAWERGLPARLR